MSIPAQSVFPGALVNAYEREFQKLVTDRAVARLWDHDDSLWPAEEYQRESIKKNLVWLELPKQIEDYLTRVAGRAETAKKEGLDHLVFVAMGGSNLVATALISMPNANVDKNTFVLDSTDPDALRELKSQLPIERTIFVFADKAGKRLETHALLLDFLNQFKSAGFVSSGKHFIAFTEKGSYLAALAREYKFRDVFFGPAGIAARFSGLIHFSLFLAAVCHVDKAVLMEQVSAMEEACRPTTNPASNPALNLGAFLAAGELQGFNRLVILSADELESFTCRIAQLVGVSTSENGRGLIPITGQASYDIDILQRKCLVVILTSKNDTEAQPHQAAQLREMGTPLVEIELQSPTNCLAEIFKWELATALACVSLVRNPFHGDTVGGSMSIPEERLQNMTEQRESMRPIPRVSENGVNLFVEGETRRIISTLSLRDALRTFLELRKSDSYIAILPFFKPASDEELIRNVRYEMYSRLKIPVLVSTGPRYLHVLGPAYRDGPADGLFLILTATPKEVLKIPGASYTFGELQLALAETEFEALRNAHKFVIRLHFSEGPEKGLMRFRELVIQTLQSIRGISR